MRLAEVDRQERERGRARGRRDARSGARTRAGRRRDGSGGLGVRRAERRDAELTGSRHERPSVGDARNRGIAAPVGLRAVRRLRRLRPRPRALALRWIASNSSRLRPEPTATQVSGDSARCTGMCVSWRSRSSRPLQQRAAAGEHDAAVHDVGGELGRRLVERRLDRVDDLRRRAPRAPGAPPRTMRITVFGRPVSMSRPRTSAWTSSRSAHAEPISSLISSAVCWPIRSLYSRLTWLMIASSISSPPTRRLCETTMPPSEMTATSVVPPPMSTIMFPVGSATGSPAPIAAAIGSSIR